MATKVKTNEPDLSKLPMGTYPDVPELDFMTAAVRSLDDAGLDDMAERMHVAYKYLFWSRRYSLIPATRDEHTVCVGFITKYHRLLWGIPLTKPEQDYIARATAAYAARKRG